MEFWRYKQHTSKWMQRLGICRCQLVSATLFVRGPPIDLLQQSAAGQLMLVDTHLSQCFTALQQASVILDPMALFPESPVRALGPAEICLIAHLFTILSYYTNLYNYNCMLSVVPYLDLPCTRIFAIQPVACETTCLSLHCKLMQIVQRWTSNQLS